MIILVENKKSQKISQVFCLLEKTHQSHTEDQTQWSSVKLPIPEEHAELS